MNVIPANSSDALNFNSMPVPKQHHSRLRQKRGRERFALEVKQTQECPKCASPILSHQACSVCGTYRGRVVVGKKVKAVAAKKAVKTVAKKTAKKVTKKVAKKTVKAKASA